MNCTILQFKGNVNTYDRAAEAEANVSKLQTMIQAISDLTHAWQTTESMTENDRMDVLLNHGVLTDYVSIAFDYCAALEEYFKAVQVQETMEV